MVNPLTTDVSVAGTSAVPVPETVDHNPVPVTAALAASVAVVTLHRFWSGPAAEVVGNSSTAIETSSWESGQTPLEIVQRITDVAPLVKELTTDVGEAGVSALPEPLKVVQTPVPVVAVLPARVAVVTSQSV